MPGKKNDNPLLETQREKAGAKTFEKYSYQYHWALYRVLLEHDNVKEYAVFVELHEDVVLSSSLDSSTARFEFNQVKTNAQAFTSANLTKLKNKSSVIGKLAANKVGKKYSDKIDKLNLVSTSGYSLKLKDPKLELKILSLTDIDQTEYDTIKKCLKAELGIDDIPKEIHFVKSDLTVNQFQKVLIGEISVLISRLYPDSKFNPNTIYQLLIDELNVKGQNTTDYTEWQDLIEKKSLTSATIQQVFENFTTTKSEVVINSEFTAIAQELSLSAMAVVSFRQEFDRYRANKLKNKNASQIDTSTKIKDLITKYKNSCGNQIATLITMVKADLPDKNKKQFLNDGQLDAAIVCEFLIK